MKVQNKTHNLSFFNPHYLGINPILLKRERESHTIIFFFISKEKYLLLLQNKGCLSGNLKVPDKHPLFCIYT